MEERHPRVLVVEDSATMRSFLVAVLEGDGSFEVHAAASGFEALKRLPRERFDLFITDINMPGINGLELIRFIRESDAHARVPLLIISTDGAERDRERGLRLGANAYLVKPFAPEVLIETARRILSDSQPGASV
jgi:two-component system chemotaxis response regulator CheY